MFKRKIALILIAASLILSGCSASENESVKENIKESEKVSVPVGEFQNISFSDVFSDRDTAGTYDRKEAEEIKLNGSSANASSSGVSIKNNVVTIKRDGVYIVSGKLNDGYIVVDAGKRDKIQIVLDGAEITSSNFASIYAKKADKVFVTLAEDSENKLINNGAYSAIDENSVDAAIFSKCDLTLNGTGSLEIVSESGHGVVSKDELVITDGTYKVTSARHCLNGKDDIGIAGGSFDLKAGGDTIHSENSDNAALGYIYIYDGTFNMESIGDGISGGGFLTVDDGVFSMKCEDISVTEDSEKKSCKGLKCEGPICINDGEFIINSTDDGIHADDDIIINNGNIEISTGDDAIHSGSAISINGGKVNILESFEGLEGLSVGLYGGEVSIVSDDDGINSSGSDQNEFDVLISDGNLTINADGDGIDSNGRVCISGGNTVIYGPESDDNSALDFEFEAKITGGKFIALGNSRMAETFSESSTQCSALFGIPEVKGDSEIVLKDSEGNELIKTECNKRFDSVLVSTPDMKKDSEYTLSVNGEETTVKQTSVSVMTGINAPGNPGDGFGKAPDDMQNPHDGMQMPPNDMKEPPESGASPDGEPPRDFDGKTPPEMNGEKKPEPPKQNNH